VPVAANLWPEAHADVAGLRHYAFEAVFGAAASIIFYDEMLTPKLFTGFILTFAAVLISETKLDFLKKKEEKESLP
jgi:drug/metabolite transporter (DMT)-like permease